MVFNKKTFTAELLGTFALVFFGTGAVMVDHISGGALGTLGIAAVFGAVVSAIIYGLGEVSGAHINPAVSIAFALSGRFSWGKVPAYLLAQLLGAVLASYTLAFLLPETTSMGETRPLGEPWPALILEGIFTFFLMLVIIFVSSGSKEKGVMAGLAIGLVVFMEAAMGGPLTGASMNPARSFGPDVVLGDFSYFHIYLSGPFVGAALAIGVWKILTHK
ncbi:MAG: aquaporin [Owenweeksia sp.]